ncbi:sensor histidine kinase [Salinispirillum marinum]|uniref:histidine kinase n=2 Tax=Saccharospirillaceae TaxID=255527 RepID=A0ABV8BKL7_9GAMM
MKRAVKGNVLATTFMVYAMGFFLLLTLLTAGAQYYMSYSVEQRNREDSIVYTIDNFEPFLADALWNFAADLLAEQVDAMARNPYITGVRVLDVDGLMTSEAGVVLPKLNGIPSVASDWERVRQHDTVKGWTNEYRFPLMREIGGEMVLIGVGQLFSADSVVQNQLRPVWGLTLAVILLSALAFTAVLVLCIRYFVAKPLELVSKALQTISPGSHAAPISPQEAFSLQRRNDELGEVYRTIETMRLGLIARDEEIRAHQENLEAMVEERTQDLQQANDHLAETIEKLTVAQQELVEAEKMASLGGLVSGVAHEVNTPLGVSVTAASHLSDEVQNMQKSVNAGSLTKTQFNEFVINAGESCDIILGNLQRAASLIRSFKQVAVDQTSEERREIKPHAYLNDVLHSLVPKLKKTQVTVAVEGGENIRLQTYPGALAQIITNLIMNALTHAFQDGAREGHIRIGLHTQDAYLAVDFCDDGVGMTPEISRRVFEPFFTTQRGRGGSGLGLHIVYNLVVQRLQGKIRCVSHEGKGTCMHILLPLKADQ